MSLITRCPSCGTMFKVVPDQLRVSEGWVRCGHCAEVFDATQNMWTPPETPSAAASRPASTSPSPSPSAATPGATAPAGAPRFGPTAPASQPNPAHIPTPVGHGSGMPHAAATATAAVPERPRYDPSPDAAVADPPFTRAATYAGEVAVDPDDADWRRHEPPLTDPDTVLLDPDPPLENLFRVTDPPADTGVPTPGAPEPRSEREPAPKSEPEPEPEPASLSFLTAAQKPSIWRKPAVRVGLVVLLLVLLAALLFQVLVHERNRVAAVEPATRPMLAALCQWTGCILSPLRQIESVVIDNSSFSRIRGDNYRLGFSLRNMAAIDVAIPAIELALTDAQDQAVVRRVIQPAEFGASTDILAASAIWSASLALRVDPSADPQAGRIAGYRLLAFYP